MAHVVAPNFRGKGKSTAKVTKNGEPKRSGNWSASEIKRQSMQSKDYQVRLVNGGLIVGDHTPLHQVMGKTGYLIEELALKDEYLNDIVRRGNATINGKEYEACKRLTKAYYHYSLEDVRYIYREMIYTMGDFEYTFPEY